MRTVAARQNTPTFGTLVKHWRLARRMSQLTLALEAEISARRGCQVKCVTFFIPAPARQTASQTD
jgi:hypothetical protein